MTAAVISDAELVEALRLHAEHGSWDKASAATGIAASTLQKRGGIAKARGLTAETPVLDEKEKLRIALAQAQRDIRALTKENETAERVRTEIFNIASRSPAPPAWLGGPSRAPSISREVPVTIWSDWHYGEVVLPGEVGGMNEFNSSVAADRITRLVDDTIDICFNHMGKAKKDPPGIVIMLGGDMITGDIHEELAVTNDRTTMQSVHDLTDLIASALDRMADKFGKVFVPCVVGNHGRGTMKPRMKQRVHTSYEWLLYTALERHFRRDKRIQFLIPGESDAYFKVYGHRFLLTHGDSMGVQGGDGIIGALGPITRGAFKVGRSEAQIGRDFDTLVIGHWHQAIWGTNVIVNNCLKGYDEYARLKLRAPYAPASQLLWWVHPTRGITARREVVVQPPINAATEREWLSWTA